MKSAYSAIAVISTLAFAAPAFTQDALVLPPDAQMDLRAHAGKEKIKPNKLDKQLSIGAEIPAGVALSTVPESLYKKHGKLKGYQFFIFGDRIFIVDSRTHRVVFIL
jgi:Protein of unknown function (DUF1236)